MSKLSFKMSNQYLRGNPRALKLLGCFFLELIIERASYQKKERGVFLDYFFNHFVNKSQIDPTKSKNLEPVKENFTKNKEKPPKANRSTWNRWRNTKSEKSPLLSDSIERTLEAYYWAKDETLINKDEAELLSSIFKIIYSPTTAMGEFFDEELYFSYLNDVLTYWCDFEFKDSGDGEFRYIHRSTGIQVDSATLDVIDPTNNVEFTKLENAGLLLAMELNKLGEINTFSDEDLLEMSLIMFDFLNQGGKGDHFQFKGKPIQSWFDDERISDLVGQYMMSEVKSIVEKMGMIYGKKATRARMTELWNFVMEVS